MISLRRIGVVMAHELRIIRRDPLPVMVMIAFPIISMAFLKPAFQPALVQAGHPGANGAEQVVPGQAVLSGFFVVSLMVFAFFSEYFMATWDRLRASQATSLEIIIGKGLPRIGMSIAQFVVTFGVGIPLFDLNVRGSVLAMLPLVVALATCFVLLGIAVTAVARTAQQASAFSIVGMVLFGAIGGALVPFNVLPGWARTIAPVTPTYWAMRGFRSIILDGNGFGGIVTPVAVLAGMTLAFAFIAIRWFRFDQVKSGWM
jgi:ABC-2 type transport system permease protein